MQSVAKDIEVLQAAFVGRKVCLRFDEIAADATFAVDHASALFHWTDDVVDCVCKLEVVHISLQRPHNLDQLFPRGSKTMALVDKEMRVDARLLDVSCESLAADTDESPAELPVCCKS